MFHFFTFNYLLEKLQWTINCKSHKYELFKFIVFLIWKKNNSCRDAIEGLCTCSIPLRYLKYLTAHRVLLVCLQSMNFPPNLFQEISTLTQFSGRVFIQKNVTRALLFITLFLYFILKFICFVYWESLNNFSASYKYLSKNVAHWSQQHELFAS